MKLQTPWLTIPSGLFILLLSGNAYGTWLNTVKVNSDLASSKKETINRQQLDLEIAKARFDKGCIAVVNNGQDVQLRNNMAIYGRGTADKSQRLADGTVVCSRVDGGTAVMKNGVTSEFAANIDAGNYYFNNRRF